MRVLSYAGSLLLGFAILGTSLLSASQPFAFSTPVTSHTSLYVSSRMLPDHLLYPVAMALDRLALFTAKNEKRHLKEISLSFDRLDSVTYLLQKNKPQLALATLKKSQHYLLVASTRVQNDPQTSPETKQYLRRALRAHIRQTEELRAAFPMAEQQAVSDMLTQSTSLYTNLPPAVY